MNTFNCTITERHRPERVVDYTATITLDDDCSLSATGFLSIELAQEIMRDIALDKFDATLTFTLPSSHAQS